MRGTRFVRLAKAALSGILQMAVPGLYLVCFALPRLRFNDCPGRAEFLNLTVQRSVFVGSLRLTVQMALSAWTRRRGLPGTSHWWSWAMQQQMLWKRVRQGPEREREDEGLQQIILAPGKRGLMWVMKGAIVTTARHLLSPSTHEALLPLRNVSALMSSL